MALNAFQQQVQALAKKLGLKGSREREVYSRPEYQQLLQSFFGEIQLPAGVDPSQVISRDAGQLTYKDAEGYTHRLERNLDGSSPDLARVTETSTDRPAVLPTKADPRANQTMDAITATLGQFFGLPVGPTGGGTTTPEATTNAVAGGGGIGKLGNLSAADKALLDSITKADLDQIRQQFTTQGGKLVAQLYGRGMNESSLGNDLVSRLTQDQGLVESRVMADAAAREIQAREFLTQLATGASTDLFKAFLGADTERAVSSGNIGLGEKQLGQQTIQDARQYQLEQKKLDLMKQAQSPWRSILSTVASLGAAAIPGLGLFGGGATKGTSTFPVIGMEG